MEERGSKSWAHPVNEYLRKSIAVKGKSNMQRHTYANFLGDIGLEGIDDSSQ